MRSRRIPGAKQNIDSRDVSTSLTRRAKFMDLIASSRLSRRRTRSGRLPQPNRKPVGAGIEHRHVVVENAAASQRADSRYCNFLRQIVLRCVSSIILKAKALSAMMKREKCACGVNGGYFDTEFKPIGLRISDGRTFSPLRRARLITGILLQSSRALTSFASVNFLTQKKSSLQFSPGHFSSREAGAFVV